VHFIFNIPVRVAQELIGFRHDGASSAAFEVYGLLRETSPNGSFGSGFSIERWLKGTSVDDISLIAKCPCGHTRGLRGFNAPEYFG
jgi:hypothetical protein